MDLSVFGIICIECLFNTLKLSLQNGEDLCPFPRTKEKNVIMTKHLYSIQRQKTQKSIDKFTQTKQTIRI